jgi:hypothetical protein
MPANNDRTAWRPFGLPMLLAVPHSRDTAGAPLPNSEVLDCLIVIEGAPDEALVAGPEHVGMRYPDRELFRRTLSFMEVLSRQITSIDTLTFIANSARTADDGTPIAIGDEIIYSQAMPGDFFLFTSTSGVADQIQWYPDVDYYDLSDVLIETEELPSRHYVLAYLAHFYLRVIINDGYVDPATNQQVQELLCIDVSQVGLACFRFNLNHPGEVIDDMYRLTPPPYFTAAQKANDTTIALYRPFSDILQDIFDEQRFLECSNWVYKVPFQAIPYLAAQLGWDIPYFPASLDDLRRAVLRNTVKLQKLKGSRVAVIALMNLFGYDVLINNLWYSTDGKTFIEPGTTPPPSYSAQAITNEPRYQLEPLLASYATSSFGQLVIPLLYLPQELKSTDPYATVCACTDITIDAYLVPASGAADQALAAICATCAANPTAYADQSTTPDQDGYLPSWPVRDALAGLNVSDLKGVSRSQVLVVDGVATAIRQSGPQPPLALSGVSVNAAKNQVDLTFNGYLDLSNQRLYVFAVYVRYELVVPPALTNLFSNRFTLQLMSRVDESPPPTNVIDFLLDFLGRVKAFHSLLYVIKYLAELDESYQVTDLCVGGDFKQRYNTDAGRQQVPPAIIPKVPGEHCEDFSPLGLGYKKSDLLYRQRVLGALLEEWEAWKAQNGRPPTPTDGLLLLPMVPNDPACQYTAYGQDLVIANIVAQAQRLITWAPPVNADQPAAASDSSLKLADPAHKTVLTNTNSDSSVAGPFQADSDALRSSFCKPDGKTDYCYKGRVADVLLSRLTLAPTEIIQGSPCGLSMGNGVYWAYPVPATLARTDIEAGTISGLGDWPDHVPIGTNLINQPPQLDLPPGWPPPQTQAQQLGTPYKAPLPHSGFSWLGRLNRAYDLPQDETIHYDNRPYLGDPRQWQQLALLRPGLNIKRPIMHLPGCRFPTMNKLKSNFTHPTWRAKPWDDPYTKDVPSCGGVPSYLGAYLIPVTYPSGPGEELVYEDVPFVITGNGLEPDVSSLGGHVVPSYLTADDVIHRVYSAQLGHNHPAIVFDQIDAPLTGGTEITTNEPLFPSATPLGQSGDYIDYVDGYPSQTGFIPYEGADLDRDGLYRDLFILMGLLAAGGTELLGTARPQILFLAASGIRVEKGLRLDCGCLLALAGQTSTSLQQQTCSLGLYDNTDGNYDFSVDQLQVDYQLVATEGIGGSSWRLDGSIPTLFETNLSAQPLRA